MVRGGRASVRGQNVQGEAAGSGHTLRLDLVNPKAQRLSRNPVLLEGRDQQGLLSDQGWLKGFYMSIWKDRVAIK